MRSSGDRLHSDTDDYSNREIEQLMMPGTYRPRRHRDRKMPKRQPRTTAVWTSETPGYTT